MIKTIVGGDSLPCSKPSRFPLDFVIQQLDGRHDNALLVGDSTIDQLAAAEANVPFVFFRSGYNDGVDESKAMSVIDRMPQLLDLFDFNDAKNTRLLANN